MKKRAKDFLVTLLFKVLIFLMGGVKVEEAIQPKSPVEKELSDKTWSNIGHITLAVLSQPVKLNMLSFLLDMSERTVRETINIARKKGIAILPSKDGYFLSVNAREIQKFISSELDTRIDDLLETKVAMQAEIIRISQGGENSSVKFDEATGRLVQDADVKIFER